MRRGPILVLMVSCLAWAVPDRGRAGPLEALLDQASDVATVRARLVARADSLAAPDPGEAARSLAHVALSFAREGEPDSAVAWHERAFALDSRPDRRMDLVEALLARLGSGDAARARDLLRPVQPVTPELPDVGQATEQGLFAWAHFLAGNPDSAVRLFAPVETWLSVQRTWRYRMAVVAFGSAEWVRVMELLTPLAVASRTHDGDVMEMLVRAASELNAKARLEAMLGREIARRDGIQRELMDAMGARRVGFRGADGFPLGGVLLAPAGARRHRAAVVVMAPGDTLALYDTLAAGLRNLGLAVLLLEPRGSGRSVAPGCPLPETWRGREARMEALVAGDVRAAANALAREAGADSAHYLVVGLGPTAPMAIRAAALDRRVAALMLVSPVAAPVDRGALRAALAGIKRPVYFQTGPEDSRTWGLIDALYAACDPRASRVADSDRAGTMATLFRRDPRIMERFRRWLAESWPRPAAPRATPPSPRRKG